MALGDGALERGAGGVTVSLAHGLRPAPTALQPICTRQTVPPNRSSNRLKPPLKLIPSRIRHWSAFGRGLYRCEGSPGQSGLAPTDTRVQPPANESPLLWRCGDEALPNDEEGVGTAPQKARDRGPPPPPPKTPALGPGGPPPGGLLLGWERSDPTTATATHPPRPNPRAPYDVRTTSRPYHSRHSHNAGVPSGTFWGVPPPPPHKASMRLRKGRLKAPLEGAGRRPGRCPTASARVSDSRERSAHGRARGPSDRQSRLPQNTNRMACVGLQNADM